MDAVVASDLCSRVFRVSEEGEMEMRREEKRIHTVRREYNLRGLPLLWIHTTITCYVIVCTYSPF